MELEPFSSEFLNSMKTSTLEYILRTFEGLKKYKMNDDSGQMDRLPPS